jgi:NhaP-type Na+/H+ or K+/H+ antiporter
LIVKFSATICATDSVAALTIIKPEKYPKLFSVVFGEGMVNDAVAIILFKVVGGMFDDNIDDKNKLTLVAGTIGQFFLTIVASLAIGVVTALVCTKLFK